MELIGRVNLTKEGTLMRYGMVAAATAIGLSLGVMSAGAQGTQRTAAQNAWCAVHMNQCNPQHDNRHDRSDIVKDLRKVQRTRTAVSANRRDLRADQSAYAIDPSPAGRREVSRDRARIASEHAAIHSADRGIVTDRRELRRDRRQPNDD